MLARPALGPGLLHAGHRRRDRTDGPCDPGAGRLLLCAVVIAGLLGLAGPPPAPAQGFAGLGSTAEGFAEPVAGRDLVFPDDHGAHPAYRIEWWYLTANLRDAEGALYGVQWTLFRTALTPFRAEGWNSPQIWFAHAGLSRAEAHYSAERRARGGIGQAGVTAEPFHAWIDDWSLQGDLTGEMQVVASGAEFSYALQLTATGPLVRHGENGYSVKSPSGQASYYYSQPFFEASGELLIEGVPVPVSGQAWLDREWSSQPLSETQEGWDWMALHLEDGARLMAFQLREGAGQPFVSGSWITAEGTVHALDGAGLTLTPTQTFSSSKGDVPTRWAVALADPPMQLSVTALNPESWMAVTPPYWEGPVRVEGSATGWGYLEMTGYD